MSTGLVLTCEHGGCEVPPAYARLFRGAEGALRSHRGWDPGALALARDFERALGAPLLACTVTRLLIDLNRSHGHARLFSEWSLRLSEREREELIETLWQPHRTALERELARATSLHGRVLHLSVHSFTPVWDDRPREVEVGLLYDPARPGERAFAGRWAKELATREATLRVRRNAPYRGTADGLTTTLRQRHGDDTYLGFELEVSQAFPLGDTPRWRRLRLNLVESLRAALATLT